MFLSLVILVFHEQKAIPHIAARQQIINNLISADKLIYLLVA
jgi:hypothetical protein